MDERKTHGQGITQVDPASPAQKAGIKPGDILLSVEGQPVIDLIDYEYLTVSRSICLSLERNGEPFSVQIRKDEYEPLGLSFATSLMDKVRVCRNRCLFCFVDQMPRGVRTSLSFKDDDWRLSFIMGNYITLTNVSENEFDRMLSRKVSPLYISVHATEPGLRSKLMGNPTAGRIMERLTKLAESGISFHAQIVLCPGINDGKSLLKSLNDLAALAPFACSAAIVPVGLTKFRDGLYPLRAYTPEEAGAIIDMVEELQKQFLINLGTRFAFLSDEWYLLAGRTLPGIDDYEGYPQIENGVGLIRMFEEDLQYALKEREPLKKPAVYSFAGGMSATPVMTKLLEKCRPYGISFKTFPIKNRFFGGNVSVAGLVTGNDLIAALKGRLDTEILFIPKVMLREQEDVFLDDMKLSELESELQIRIVPVAGAEDLINKIWMEEEHE